MVGRSNGVIFESVRCRVLHVLTHFFLFAYRKCQTNNDATANAHMQCIGILKRRNLRTSGMPCALCTIFALCTFFALCIFFARTHTHTHTHTLFAHCTFSTHTHTHTLFTLCTFCTHTHTHTMHSLCALIV